MKMRWQRGVLWSLGALVILGTTANATGTELAQPRNWKANLGEVDTKECDQCRCKGKRERRCNAMTGQFDDVNDTCSGVRIWSEWGNWGPYSVCKFDPQANNGRG